MFMNKKELDFTHFSPEVFQAVAGENYTVYAYMNDGNVRVLDVKPLIEKGGVFKILQDKTVFREKLTVLNQTVAWDITGKREKHDCIDIDPFSLFESPIVADFPETISFYETSPFPQTDSLLDRVSENKSEYKTNK